MRVKIYTLIIILVIPLISLSQIDEKKNFGIKFSGFVKSDFFADTRQTVAAREGHFLLFPANESMDENGDDINDGLNTNFLSIQSRLSGKITGPDAFGAKTSGLIEGDFFAQANDNINLFRMRHAFVKLSWEKTSLLMGQYWNPFFVTDCFPGTVSFNTGAPIQPFARNPQIRLTHNISDFRFTVAALSQRDYVSRGMNGASSEYLRNAGLPDFHGQLQFSKKIGSVKLIVGGGVAYKSIMPSLSVETINGTFQNEETVSGLSEIFYAKVTTPSITFKVEHIMGQNICDVLSIGGFAQVEAMDANVENFTYTPTETSSTWFDAHTNGKKFQLGCFAGFTKNNGAADDAAGPVYGLGTSISELMRVSPRIIWNSGKTRFAFELEYTKAEYGFNNLTREVPEGNSVEVANIRGLFAVYYFF